MRRIIASLDIGSCTSKLIIGEFFKNKLNILAVIENESKGLKNGLVVHPELLVGSLRELFNKANDMVGIPIKKVVLSVSNQEAQVNICEGSTNVVGEDKKVTNDDIQRVIQASIHNSYDDQRVILNTVATLFRINDDNVVKNPLGMNADKISVKTVITDVPIENIEPILKCLKHLDIEVVKTYISSIGDYYTNKQKNMDNNCGIIINLGDQTSTISVFNKGILANTTVLNLGGNNVDKDIEFIYKTTSNEAKKLKEKLSLAHNRLAQANETIELTNKLGETVKINQYELSEIVMYRLAEILNLIKKQINHLTKKKISYIIFTGGVTESTDFALILEEIFGKSVTIGNIKEIGVRNNKFSSCVGLLKKYNEELNLKDTDFSIFSIEEQEEFSGFNKTSIPENSILGKLFGYFFDS